MAKDSLIEMRSSDLDIIIQALRREALARSKGQEHGADRAQELAQQLEVAFGGWDMNGSTFHLKWVR